MLSGGGKTSMLSCGGKTLMLSAEEILCCFWLRKALAVAVASGGIRLMMLPAEGKR